MQPEHLKLIKAIGFQYSSYVHVVLLNWILKFMSPAVPVKAFKQKEKALAWLEPFK